MTHEKVDQREEYAPLDDMKTAGYVECQTTIPIEEEQPLLIIHDIDNIDDTPID